MYTTRNELLWLQLIFQRISLIAGCWTVQECRLLASRSIEHSNSFNNIHLKITLSQKLADFIHSQFMWTWTKSSHETTVIYITVKNKTLIYWLLKICNLVLNGSNYILYCYLWISWYYLWTSSFLQMAWIYFISARQCCRFIYKYCRNNVLIYISWGKTEKHQACEWYLLIKLHDFPFLRNHLWNVLVLFLWKRTSVLPLNQLFPPKFLLLNTDSWEAWFCAWLIIASIARAALLFFIRNS